MDLCDAVSDNMVAYREMYNLMEGKFEGCELKHIETELATKKPILWQTSTLRALQFWMEFSTK
jgi:hypothetical protein